MPKVISRGGPVQGSYPYLAPSREQSAPPPSHHGLSREQRGGMSGRVRPREGLESVVHCQGNADVEYRGTSLIINRTPPRTAIGPYAYAYCRVRGSLPLGFHYQSTLDAVYVYVVPWSEFPIVPSYPHYPHCQGNPDVEYRGTSLIRNHLHLGPFSRHLPRALQ